MSISSHDKSVPGDPPSINMDDLRRRMERQENQYARLRREQSRYDEGQLGLPEAVHVILFSPGTPEQTAHTIESPPKSGNNFILAFENREDCVAFSRVLQDLEFVNPSPEETVYEPFHEYCKATGLSVMIVPEGFELTPPQINSNVDYDEGDICEDDDIVIVPKEKEVNDEMDAWG